MLHPDGRRVEPDARRTLFAIEHSKIHRIAADVIGETTSENLEIKVDGKVVVFSAVRELRVAYENALENVLRTDPELVTT